MKDRVIMTGKYVIEKTIIIGVVLTAIEMRIVISHLGIAENTRTKDGIQTSAHLKNLFNGLSSYGATTIRSSRLFLEVKSENYTRGDAIGEGYFVHGCRI